MTSMTKKNHQEDLGPFFLQNARYS